MIEEVAEDRGAATNITKALAFPGYQAGIRHKYVNPPKYMSNSIDQTVLI